MPFSLYNFARRCFWSLPYLLRYHLYGARNALMRWFRWLSIIAGRKARDLAWVEFCNVALKGILYRAVIILEPNIYWKVTLFQRPQQMALALGRLGCLVIYKTNGDSLIGFRQMAENVWIANDPAVNAIPNAVRVFYSTAPLTMPKGIHAACRRGRVIYEYIDHMDAMISGGGSMVRHLRRMKQIAFNYADIVVSSAAVLHEEALAHSKAKHCALIPNGADVRHFRDVPPLMDLPEPLRSFRGGYQRIVGYFGAIAPWLWYEAIEQASVLMPDVGFAFIGQDYHGCITRLPKRSNVIYLGPVDYAFLPAYARLFDVCFIPFRPGDVARTTSPVKLFEYFALEKPVVVTANMSECVAFPGVFSGSDAIGLTEAINNAFAVCGEESYCIKLRGLADKNSWDVRAGAYLSALES